ncbi:MAG: SPFH/Band 7/PHB domain protein [Caldisericia bacterium]|nr:SPFH/Band 7/PHB domain protein [Caldisericia bacterium]
MSPLSLTILVTVLVLVFINKGLIKIRPFQKGVVERLGKYIKTLDSGLNVIMPFFDTVKKVDMRESLIDVPPQEVITKDNVVVTVDAVIYYEVTDPFRVLYNVAMFRIASVKLAQTNLRNIIGELELDSILSSREHVNANLRNVLDEATDKWGVKVTRVEIKRIDPPHDITEAMSRQMKAERTKRAAILEAEGIKQSQITRAEGEKQSAILEAEGKKRSVILGAEGQAQATERKADAAKYKIQVEAQGEADAIYQVYTSIHKGKPTKELITIQYLEALKKLADGKSSKIFIPYESSQILGSLGMISEVFKGASEKPAANLLEETVK